MYVPADAGFIRVLDEFKNTTAAPIELSVELHTQQYPFDIHHTSSGDTLLTTDDNYIAIGNVNNASAPASTVVFSGASPLSLAPSNIFQSGSQLIYQYDLTVPAYDSIILMSFAAANQTVENAIQKGDDLELPAPDILMGIWESDIDKIINFKITTGAE